jgi:hypothetical protein
LATQRNLAFSLPSYQKHIEGHSRANFSGFTSALADFCDNILSRV